MPTTCDRCEATSETGDGYSRIRLTFSTQRYVICPHCLPECQRRRQRKHRIFYWAVMATCITTVALLNVDAAIRLIGLLALIYAFDWFFVVLHEAAHALAAAAMGGRVFLVRVGYGPRLGALRVGGARVECYWIPGGGVTQLAFEDPRGIRMRHAVAVAAGPLVHAVAIGALFAFAPDPIEWNLYATDGGYNVWSVALVVNAALLAISLYPAKAVTAMGEAYTDGAQLWKDATGGTRRARELHANYFVVAAAFRGLDHDAVNAERLAVEGRSLYPESEALRFLHAQAHLIADRFELARELLESITESDRFAVLVNMQLATCALFGEPQDMEAADVRSERAFRALPGVEAARLVRGEVLVETSRADEATPILTRLAHRAESFGIRSAANAFLARAAHLRGDAEERDRRLDTARADAARDTNPDICTEIDWVIRRCGLDHAQPDGEMYGAVSS